MGALYDARSQRPPRAVVLVLVLGATLALAVAACTPTEEDSLSATEGLPDLQQQLSAHDWILDGDDSSVEPVETAPITLRFEDGLAAGNAGCNTYRGSVTIDEFSLRIGDLATTRKQCPEAIMEAEQQYLRALEAVRDVDATDRTRLVLTDDDGARLAYDVAPKPG